MFFFGKQGSVRFHNNIPGLSTDNLQATCSQTAKHISRASFIHCHILAAKVLVISIYIFYPLIRALIIVVIEVVIILFYLYVLIVLIHPAIFKPCFQCTIEISISSSKAGNGNQPVRIFSYCIDRGTGETNARRIGIFAKSCKISTRNSRYHSSFVIMPAGQIEILAGTQHVVELHCLGNVSVFNIYFYFFVTNVS